MPDPYQSAVEEFMRLFDQPVGSYPALPSTAVRALRVDLIREELSELETAFAQGDLVETADALGDLAYVVFGAAAACGIQLLPIFREIHRSNLSKVGGHYRADGKLLKPATWSRPCLALILAAQLEQSEAK